MNAESGRVTAKNVFQICRINDAKKEKFQQNVPKMSLQHWTKTNVQTVEEI